MKGDIISFDLQTRADPLTGVPVTRITDDQGSSEHPYFTASQIDPDGRFVLAYNNRGGTNQLYTVELERGRMVQLTQDEDVKGACLDAANQRAFYFAGRTLKCLRLDTLAEEDLMEVPTGFTTASLSCTRGGRYTAFTMIENDGMEFATARFTSEFSGGSKGFREHFLRRPASVIMRYDMQEHSAYAVTGDLRRMTHVILHPHDGDTVLFCHEGPWKLVQRMWIAKVATDEVYPLVKTEKLLESAGHEFFTTTGRVGVQYAQRYRPDMNFLFFADLYINPDGSDERRYYYPFNRPVHVFANSEDALAVGDTAQISADDGDFSAYIGLIRYDRELHRAVAGKLCRHDTSWRKVSHPHPVLTPDGSRVLWGSDVGGRMNLYTAPADWDRCIKSKA